jgi:hypothetical protein
MEDVRRLHWFKQKHVQRFPTPCLASIKLWTPLLGAKPSLSLTPIQAITPYKSSYKEIIIQEL